MWPSLCYLYFTNAKAAEGLVHQYRTGPNGQYITNKLSRSLFERNSKSELEIRNSKFETKILSFEFRFLVSISSFDFEFLISSFGLEFQVRVTISSFKFELPFRVMNSSFDFEFWVSNIKFLFPVSNFVRPNFGTVCSLCTGRLGQFGTDVLALRPRQDNINHHY